MDELLGILFYILLPTLAVAIILCIIGKVSIGDLISWNIRTTKNGKYSQEEANRQMMIDAEIRKNKNDK